MKMLSLFSGIGGIDLAAELAGIETVAFCEINEYCQKVLKKQWPDVPIYSDIRDLRGEQIGTVDIVAGGFPCQPYSIDASKAAWYELDQMRSRLDRVEE
jgi:DNA (cytosine-5)-methyltransferase 1